MALYVPFRFSVSYGTIRRADWMGQGANLRKYMTNFDVAGTLKPLMTSPWACLRAGL
jgi:hypothetical protein